MLFGRQPLYQLELPPREPEVRGQRSEVRKRRAGIEPAPSALARRRSGPLNYRRVVSRFTCSRFTFSSSSWARLESNQHLRFFRPPLDRRAADPARGARSRPALRAPARDAPPVGLAPTTSCLTSKRSCCLSYGGVRCVSIVKEPLSQTTSAEGGGFEPPRALRPRALAPRCNEPLCQPSVFDIVSVCRCVGVSVCNSATPTLPHTGTPTHRDRKRRV